VLDDKRRRHDVNFTQIIFANFEWKHERTAMVIKYNIHIIVWLLLDWRFRFRSAEKQEIGR
jgi:hypothetical protein